MCEHNGSIQVYGMITEPGDCDDYQIENNMEMVGSAHPRKILIIPFC